MAEYSRKKNNKNKKNNEENKTKKKKKKVGILKYTIISILLICFIGAGAGFGLLYGIVKSIPPFDPPTDINRLYEHSEIYSDNGDRIERIQTEQFRAIIPLDQMSDHVQNAFIAVEDERFEDHLGIDTKSIFRAIYVNIKERSFAQGFSSITQQLARNIYLTKDKEIIRKIKEMYYAIEMEKVLTKDQILEAYLNTISLGQGAYGVEAAAEIYFSKSAKDLTIAESAMIAGATKSPSYYDLYDTVKPSDIDPNSESIVGEIEILGERYYAVFNEKALKRQRLILKKMLNLNMITEEEYNEALNQDMKASIKPGKIKTAEIETSYFTDYVKSKVVEDLVNKNGMKKEEATKLLYTGGLKIYTTMNLDMQGKVEDIYNNFDEPLKSDVANSAKGIKYLGKNTLFDKYGNILDDNRRIAFYKKQNFLDDNGNIIIEKGTYSITDSKELSIKNNKINYRNLDVANHYEVDEDKTLITYTGRYLNSVKASEDYYTIDNDNKSLVIKKSFLDKNLDFYSIDEKGNLLINTKYIYVTRGIVQPQSSIVILDYKTGEVKAIVGGRGVKGERIFNRATSAPRQPGSSIKPLSIYLPALDNNFTAGTIIDDVPHYNSKGVMWPQNHYGKTGDRNGYVRSKSDDFYGLIPIRMAVYRSANIPAVRVLKDIGIDTSVRYLTKLGIINEDDPSSDTFISKNESSNSDEDLAPLSLGGMTKGVTPLVMASAFGAIANQGVYTEPIVYTKVENRDGEIILSNQPERSIVVNPDVAYVMTDILKGVVNDPSGTGRNAQLDNKKIPVAGKTGTTQNHGDHWFVGYTPYYTAAVWTGSDDKTIKLDGYFSTKLFGHIMSEVHKGLPDKDFAKPSGLVEREVCTVSGQLATDLCRLDPRGHKVVKEIYVDGTQPRDYCDIHVEVKIDKTNGKRATEFCPIENVETKVFIERPTPYLPSENNGYIPMDYKYYAPTEVCDEHSEADILDNINNWEEDEESEEDEGNFLDQIFNNVLNGNKEDEESEEDEEN